MKQINFLEKYQKSTARNYVERVTEHDKAECAAKAKEWGFDYWDGARQFGYGGYSYDGRWRPIAADLVKYYGLKPGDKILDVGCGKAYLLFEMTQEVEGLNVTGVDISSYGLENAKEEMRGHLLQGHCRELDFEDDSFDFVYSINTLHNLEVFDLKKAVKEIQRVSKGKSWICVESYRNEKEKANMLYWQLTCMSFYTPDEWMWLFKEWGYTGDCGFIFFE